MAKNDREVVDIKRGKALLLAGLVVLGTVGVIGLWSAVKFVPAGNVGVLVLFDSVQDTVLPEGVHLANPFAVNHVMSIRTVEMTEKVSGLSKEGLMVTLDAALLFNLNADKANKIFQTIGPRYVNMVVEPNLRAAIRSVISAYSADALSNGQRDEVAAKIAGVLRERLKPLGIHVEAVLVRDIQVAAASK